MPGQELRRAYWLASFPKSGNTWARRLYSRVKLGVSGLNINDEATILDNQVYAHKVAAPLDLADMTPEQKLFLRYTALLHIMARAPHTPLVLKTHNANIRVKHVDLIPEEMSEAAVYLIRDPRDVVISYAEHTGNDLDDMIDGMNKPGHMVEQSDTGIYHYLTTWSMHVKTWVDDSTFPVTVIRYEDLLTDPFTEFGRMLDTFGLEVDDDTLAASIEDMKFANLKRQEQEGGFIEASRHTKFFKRGTSGGWKETLTPEQVERIENDHGEIMTRFGYELTSKAAAA